MTNYNYSLSVIMPVEHVDAARRMLWALGRDTASLTSFSLKLSVDGSEPVAAYGLHATVDDALIKMLGAAHDGSLPDVSWDAAGIDAESVTTAVQASTIVYLKDGDVSQTWPAALDKAGVVPVADGRGDG